MGSEVAFNPRKSVCPECKDKTQVILDHSTGDLICTSCGLVLEGHCIDEGQEWREFKPEGVESGPHSSSRNRGDWSSIGHDLENQSEAHFGSSITGTGHAAEGLQKAQRDAMRLAERLTPAAASEQAKLDRTMQLNTRKVREVVGRLALGEAIVNRCVGMFQDLAARGTLHRYVHVPVACAFVHLASAEEHAFRTIEELAHAHVAVTGKPKNELARLIEKKVAMLRKALGLKQPVAFEDETLMTRFVTRLQLSPHVCKPASHIAQQAFRFGLIGRQPHTAVMASAILIVTWLLDVEQKPDFGKVSVIAKVAEHSTKSAYKVMHPHITRLLPEGFRCRLPNGVAGLPLPKS